MRRRMGGKLYRLDLAAPEESVRVIGLPENRAGRVHAEQKTTDCAERQACDYKHMARIKVIFFIDDVIQLFF